MFKRKFYNKNSTNGAFNQFLIIDLVLISKHATNPLTYRVAFKFFSSTYIGVFIFKRIFNNKNYADLSIFHVTVFVKLAEHMNGFFLLYLSFEFSKLNPQ